MVPAIFHFSPWIGCPYIAVSDMSPNPLLQAARGADMCWPGPHGWRDPLSFHAYVPSPSCLLSRRVLSLSSAAILIVGSFVFEALAKAGARLLDRAEERELSKIAQGGDEKRYDGSTYVRVGNEKCARWAPIDCPPAV